MRSIAWLVLGLLGFCLAFSTREDQTYSNLRLIGCLMLAAGSLGLLPRNPTEAPAAEPGAVAAQPDGLGLASTTGPDRRPHPIPNQTSSESTKATT
jgi:hypothetical protein